MKKRASGTGDLWNTDIPVKNNRVPKSSHRIEAVGSLDQASASVLYAMHVVEKHGRDDILEDLALILDQLSCATVLVSTAGYPTSKANCRLTRYDLSGLEGRIEELSALIVVPKNHSQLSYLNEVVVVLNMARTALRTAERDVIRFCKQEDRMVPMVLFALLNRYSDYLYIASLYVEQVPTQFIDDGEGADDGVS